MIAGNLYTTQQHAGKKVRRVGRYVSSLLAGILLLGVSAVGQSYVQVTNTTSTTKYNGIDVTVTSSGTAGSFSPCGSTTGPYFLPASGDSYTFTFSAPVGSVKINAVFAVSGVPGQIHFTRNGSGYSITDANLAGTIGSCSAGVLAVAQSGDLTNAGNLSSDPNNIVVIPGPITTLTISNVAATGLVFGAEFTPSSYFQVTHTSGSSTVNGVSVTATAVGGASSFTPCGAAAAPYYSPNAGDAYNFTFGTAVSGVITPLVFAAGGTPGQAHYVVNGSGVTLTSANINGQAPSSCTPALAVVVAGDLTNTGNLTSDPSGMVMLPNSGTVSSLSVQSLSTNGFVHGLFFSGGTSSAALTFNNASPQSMTLCTNAAATSITSQLAATDLNTGLPLTWSVVVPPAHGSLAGFPYSTTTTGASITPAGLTYQPTASYSGTDGFTIQVSDGVNTATATINVTMYPLPDVSNFATAAANACQGSGSVVTVTSTTLADGTYNVTYNLVGSNSATGVVGSLTMASGTGTFTTSSLSNSGATTIIITNITNPCSSVVVSSGNVAGFTVNATPGAIFVPGPVCVGSTMTVASGTAGGTYTSSNTSLATVVAATGVVTGVGAGNPVITYTLGTGCYTTVTITVNPTPNAIAGSNTVCTGLTTALTNSTAGGTWSTSNALVATVSGTGVVTGVTAGNPTITYTLPAGCFAIFPMTVSTTPPSNTGPTTVCTGLTITLANGVGGGTWTSSNTGQATVVAGTGVVTGVASGNPTITYTLPTGCTAVSPITVNTNPAAIAGANNVCVGSSTTLTNSSGGGAWTSSNTLLATVGAGTGVVTGVAVGSPFITYTMPNACFVTQAMTVNPNPAAITGPTSVCTGSNITLANATAGGTWSSSNTGLATVVAGTGVVTGVASGSPTITYTMGTNCYAVYTITVNNTPSANTGSSTVCTGFSTTLSNSTGGGVWTSSNVSVATVGSATGTVTGITAGNSDITYTLATGCFTVTQMTVNNTPSAIAGTFTVCTGTTTTLTDATAGGTWSSSNTGLATVVAGTGVVTGVSAGVPNITYTMATGCYAAQAVTVNASPAAIGGPTAVCVGSTITITDATAGGTWSSSSAGLATVGAGTGTVTGVSAGVPTMTYTAANGCIATQPITVNPTPAAIGGSSTVCTGFTTVLTNSTTGGTWSSSDITKATIGAGTGIVTGVAAGTTTITYSLATGCYSTFNMTVNASPTSITGTASVCVGFTTTLSNGIGGGTWSSSNTSLATVVAGTGVVTGVASGVPTISYVLSNGCFATIPVTVNPNPAAIGGTAVACVGSTTTLTNASSGGTWTSSNTGQATIGASSGVMTGVASGNPVITYTLPTGCFITTTATINPLPAGITGTMSVCIGFNTTLASATAGGTWSSSNTSIATVVAGTGVVTGVATGVATISYTLPTGCFATASVTVNPNPPAITGTTNVCIGLTTNLFNATGGGSWSSSNTGIATVGATTGVVTGVTSGNPVITYTLPTGCFITTPFTVNPNPAAITGTMTVCVGLTTTLSDATAGGTWSSSNTSQATVVAGTGVVTGVAAGTPTITYTLPTGCIATTTVTVNDNPTAITGTPVVCTGYTTTLASTPSGGAWTSSNIAMATVGAGTGIVTGVTAGNPVITYTLPTGCIATVVATINATPAAIAGTMSVCVGLTTTLTDATPGGTWTSSNPSQAVVGAGTGIVTGVAAGNPVITYTIPATGCYNTATVTVNSNPAIITGANNVCTGATIGLSDATTGGTWSSSDATKASIGASTGVVTGVAAGTANITYTLPTGCIAVYPVTVNQTPAAITGVMSVCTGNTTTLADGTVGGSWSSSNTSIATVVSGTGVVTGVAAGTATISYIMPTGCYAVATVTVNQTPPSITGTTSVCVGLTTTLANTLTGGSWSSSNTAQATVGSSTGIVTGVATGTPDITYTMPTGCFVSTNITVNPTPAAVTGTTVVCAGSTTTLSDATSGGVWSSGNTSIATVGSSSGVVTGVAAGVVGITYTLGAGCTASTVVTVNPVPNISNFTSTTATSPCVGNNSTVTIASTSLGSGTFTVTYDLSGANSVTSATATLTMGSTTGTFTIPSGSLTGTGFTTVTITAITNSFGCTSYPSSSNTSTFAVNALPTAYSVTGGGSYCSGGTGVHIYLSNSVGGVNYQLWLGGTAVGTPLAGTFSGLDFGLITTVGTYTVTATNATTGCTNNMSGSASVSINPLPTAFSVTGGGSYCAGGTGVTVSLSGSQTSTNYQLYVGGTPTGSPLPGTGSSLSFGLQTAAGVYTVVATNTSTTCTNSMTGSATVVINPLPSAITGTMYVCPGTTSTLSSATSGGAWSSSTPSVATIGSSTGVVTGVLAGTAVMSYTLSTGCLTTATITVNPNPAAIAGPTSVCVGSAITLTNSTGGGTWTSSNSTLATINITSGVVSGVAAGTPTMTYTLSTGCYSVYTITVNPTPAAISGASNVCVGLTTTLTDATSGGTWSSSNPSVGSIGAATGIVGGVSAGTITVTYTLPAGCNVTAPFTVNPTPAAITGTMSVCVGLTTTLADATSGGNWTSSNAAIASVNVTTGVVTGVASGTATITYTLPAGCFTTTLVTVNPTPAAIAGTNNVCVGLTTTLTDASSGGTWSSSNPAIGSIGASTGIVTGVASGTITITYTLPAGCNTTFAFTVNPNPAAIAGVTNACVGSTSTLTDATTGGSWSSSNVAIGTVGAATGIVGGVSAGVINITYALGTGCIATAPFTVNPLPASITGNTPVCAASNITLADASAGGTWTSGSPSVATIGSSTGVVTGVSAGNATVTYTLPTGCITTTVLTVHPTPAAIAGASFVCVGQTTTYTDATSGGSWSSSNTGLATVNPATGLITGVAVGTPFITYTLPPGGCIAVKMISVNPMPASITGNAPVCEGATITLANTVGGGSWSSANTSIASVNSGTGVVTGVLAGTTTISYTLPGGCYVTTVVTVNPSPTSISGSNNVCVGSTTTLTNGVSGGLWTSSSTGNATIGSTSGIVTGISAGSITITYTLPAGCFTTLAFTVNPLPAAITGTMQACEAGGTATLSNTSAGGSWTSSNTSIATVGASSGIVTGVVAGTVTITYTLPTGCLTTTGFTVNPLPIAYSVTGGGTYCAGGTGVAVGLANSQSGVNYQLYVGGSPTGTAVAGTGSAITFGLQTTPGTYTVVATNTTTSCQNTMTSSALVTVTVLPTVYNMTGGGSFCAGGTGVAVGLNGSQTGINYQLYNGITPIGSPIAGTGSSISWGLISGAGTYTAVAINSVTYCTSNMTGSSVVIVNPLPTQFTVTGGGSYCTGGSGSVIGLSGSQSGVNYTATNGSASATIGGTGGPISFGSFTSTGTYTVNAVNATTGCSVTMLGAASVGVFALPTAYTVSGGGAYCIGGSGVNITLSNSTSGVSYQLMLGTTSVGSPVAGTGSGLTFSSVTGVGTYTIIGMNTTTTCTVNMTGTATVTTNPLPAVFSVAGGGGYCTGGTGLSVTLSGSESGATYRLFRGGSTLVATLSGTGSALTFAPQTTAGIYTVTSTSGAGCISAMSGSATISINPLPNLYSVTGGGAFCVGSTGVAIGLASSDPGINYQLWLGGTAIGAPVAGTGSALNFGIFTTGGTYTVIATNPLTGCSSTMTSSALVTPNPLPALWTVSGGGSYCSGGTGVSISLSGSTTGTSYQMYVGGVPTGLAMLGTGSSITFTGVTVPGTYTVRATIIATGCLQNMTGTAVVVVNPLPAVDTVTGGGSYCAGGAGVNVGLARSVTGINYQTYVGGVLIGSPMAGTGSALNFGTFTTAGVYTVVATNSLTGCISNMFGSATISINALPAVYTVTGGGGYCAGGTGVHVGLSNSDAGIDYQLYNGSTPVGVAVAGTGADIDFGLVTIAGTYSVKATNSTTGCTSNMTGSVVVSINPLPGTFTVTGGGNYCPGGTGVEIGLGGSASGVNYQLMKGSSPVGAVVAGTGAPISFGLQTAVGTYSVMAIDATTGCTRTMTGAAVVALHALPVTYTVTGGGGYCVGGTGAAVMLSGSSTGVTYQLYFGSTPVGPSILGTGASINFGPQSAVGTYTAVATDLTTTCSNNMTGSVTVSLNPLPVAYDVTGGGGYCAGGTGVMVGLNSSDLTISYQLFRDGGSIGSPLAGTGGAISFGLQTVAGTYTVVATNTVTSCMSNMNGSATVIINALPIIYNVSGGGSYCAGGTGVHITLSSSDAGINYQLFNGTSPVGSTVAGSGAAIDFGLITSVGTYTVSATDAVTGCMSNMTGSATVAINPLPTIYAMTGGGSYCAGSTGLHVGTTGSNTGINYQLYLDGVANGTAVVGTGSALDFGVKTTGGVYTVKATNAATGCMNDMSGAVTITVNPLPHVDTVTGGGSYCPGGTGVHVGLTGSQIGVNYQLMRGTTTIGAPLAGTGSGLDFGSQTIVGTYFVVATNATTSCTINMAGSTAVNISALPTAYTVAVSASGYCAGGTGVSVTLSGSSTGVSYQLYRGTTAIGSPMTGTGFALNFGLHTNAGTYSVVATDGTTGCVNNMTGTPSITINPLPTAYTVTGGGSYCAGGTGVNVFLSNSDMGVNYQLKNGSASVGSPMAGTGYSLDFGPQTGAGTYTVVAVNATTGCQNTMLSSAMISINALPTVYYVVGGGSYCAGDAGVHIGINNSQTGISYQLMNGTVTVGTPVSGTGSSLDFGAQTATGSYTVVATNPVTGCTSTMTGAATVSITALPATFAITGGGNYCTGGTGVVIGLAGSATGVNYQLKLAGTGSVGTPVAGTGSAISFGLHTVAGTYTVEATSASTGCVNTMTGSTMVTISALPTAYPVTGGGSYCATVPGVAVNLGNSEAGVNYQLYNGSSTVGGPVAGTGTGAITFGLQPAGTYNVVATNVSTGCTNAMLGSVNVVLLPSVTPSVSITTGVGDTVCAGTAVTFTPLTVNGGSSPTFEWFVNGVSVGTGNSYTYVPTNGNIVSVTMTSSATCAIPATVSGTKTMSVRANVTPAVSISVSPNDTICQGVVVTFTPAPVWGGSTPVFNWYVNGTPRSAGSTFSYAPLNNDVVFCDMVSSYSCVTTTTPALSNNIAMHVDESTAPTVSIKVNSGVNVGTVLYNDTLTAEVTNGGLTPAYQWSVNGIAIVGATNRTYIVGTLNHNDAVSVTASKLNACGLQTATDMVIVKSTNVGVTNVAAVALDLKLVPNPNKGIFTIKGSLGTTADQDATIEMTNMLGQSIFTGSVTVRNGVVNETVQLSNGIANGMYVLTFRSGGESKVFHVVVEQ